MPDLYAFQEAGVAWLVEHKVAALADDMGLGKTAQAIVASERINARKILVIAPGIALDVWKREFAVWCPGRSVQIVRSSAAAQHLHGDVIIVSYGLLIRVCAELGRLNYDLLIADEAQSLKNPKAKRTRAIYAKGTGLIHRCKRVWLLSGTLMPNGPHEIWPAYFSLFGGKLSYPSFVSRYCITKETTYGVQVSGSNREHTPELAKHLRPFILRRRWQEVLPHLPPLAFDYIPVFAANLPELPDASIEMQAILGKLERGQALNILEQQHLATLRRLTSIAKIPLVLELAQSELDGGLDKLVIFAHHKAMISGLIEGLGPIATAIHGDTPQRARQAAIDAFQDNAMPRVLVLQLGVAGTALTLHRAHRVIFAEISWVPADVVQAAKRCHRIGQKHPVRASVVSLAGSIDEKVAAVVMRKSQELAEIENMISKENVA